MSPKRTRLLTITARNEIQLVTDDPEVMLKAQEAQERGTDANFVYWNGEETDIIEGRVTWARVTWVEDVPQCHFAVLVEEEPPPRK